MANQKEYSIKINGIQQSVEGVESLGKSMNKSSNAIKETNKQIKALQSEMVGLEKGSKQWKDLAKQAGNLKDRVDDIREATRRWASDTKGLDDVINLAQSATAAFTLYKGAMSAFGIETEGAVEAIQKLQGAMAIIQSLQTLQNTLKGSSATAALFNNTLGLLTKGMQGASLGAKALRIALASIGIGIIIGLVATLIEHWEDLVGWFDKTFPALKKMGGAMNSLKAVVVGLGKAILNWCVNPLKTMANVIQKIFTGDFKGALQAATDGIKNQFAGTVDAFNKGFKEQVERGLEDITKKSAAEAAKDVKYQLDMLKAKKGNQAKYSKEGIALQKKEFELRKKAAKGNAEELKQIALDEANFYRECEEQKTAAAKKSATARAKANKDAAKVAADAAKAEAEQAEKLLTAQRALRDEIINKDIVIAEQQKYGAENMLDAYDSGPIEKYLKYLGWYEEALDKIHAAKFDQTLYDVSDALEDNVTMVKKTTTEWQEYLQAVQSAEDISFSFSDEQKKRLVAEGKTLKQIEMLEKEENSRILTAWQKLEKLRLQSTLETSKEMKEITKKEATARKNEINALSADVEEVYNKILADVKDFKVERVKRTDFWGRLLGLTDVDKTLKKLDYVKGKWVKAQEEIDTLVSKETVRWDEYLSAVEELYGKDSQKYKDAQEEKIKALEKLWKIQEEVAKRASNPTSLSGDYNGDNQADATRKKGRSTINRNEYKTDEKGNTNWNAFWDGEQEVFENLQGLADVFYENVFDPIGEAFSALLEFQIEEAEEALDKATAMHDKSVEAVESSNQRLIDIKNEMSNASGVQLEQLKEQQADEMLLLAQREAEEKRLAREKEKREKELAKKQKEQKKMELKMQLVEGIINTAVSVTKALTWGWPLGAVFAAIIGAMGAVQTAIIAKQISKLADGGLLQGRSHAQGGIPVGNTGIEVEGGEYVVNKRSTAKYLPLLQALNEEGARKKTVANQLGKMANGGQLNYEKIDSSLNAVDTNKVIESSIKQIDIHPQVSVVDINRGQKNLTQVRQMAGGRA